MLKIIKIFLSKLIHSENEQTFFMMILHELEPNTMPNNSANQVKLDHTLDQTHSVQSGGPERAHKNNVLSSKPFWEV